MRVCAVHSSTTKGPLLFRTVYPGQGDPKRAAGRPVVGKPSLRSARLHSDSPAHPADLSDAVGDQMTAISKRWRVLGVAAGTVALLAVSAAAEAATAAPAAPAAAAAAAGK